MAPSRQEVRLDLGCGQNVRDGFEGVDLYAPIAKHRVNLFAFPLPWADNSVDELHCSHFLEHLPAREVGREDLVDKLGNRLVPHGLGVTNWSDHSVVENSPFLGQDFLFAFMDECWRILKPSAWMTVIVPSGRSNRAFQDPTHRRFFVQETFGYFNADWRKAMGLDHYRARCHFVSNVVGSIPQEETLRSEEAAKERFMHYWNVTVDWHAKLQKVG